MSSIQGNVTGRKTSSIEPALGQEPAPTSVDPEELLDCAEASKLIRQKPDTLASWRCKGRGPEYVKVGRAVFYRRSAISTWLAQQIVRPSSAA